MDQSASPAKRIPAIIAAIVIIIAPLVISRVVTYEYTNPKLFAIEAGLAAVIAAVLFLVPFGTWKKVLRQPAAWGIGLFLIAAALSFHIC